MFGTTFENFHAAAGSLMNKIRSALPEGSTKCRIRTSAREMHQPATGSLLDTLGEGDICVYHDALRVGQLPKGMRVLPPLCPALACLEKNEFPESTGMVFLDPQGVPLKFDQPRP